MHEMGALRGSDGTGTQRGKLVVLAFDLLRFQFDMCRKRTDACALPKILAVIVFQSFIYVPHSKHSNELVAPRQKAGLNGLIR
jgi:hypothetical protein